MKLFILTELRNIWVYGGGGGGLVVNCVQLVSCDPVKGSLTGSSVHGIFQARILEWFAISFSKGSCQLRDQIRVSCIAGGFFAAEPPGKHQ